jgi:hypothetical protein
MKNLEKIVFKLIDRKIVDCDKYNNKGSLWLIFTDKKRWVLEYTDQGVLWYNYTFFSDIFSLLGINTSGDRNEYITKWFESRFLNKPKVEDTIQNGVKHTKACGRLPSCSVEDTIKNGVKRTYLDDSDKRMWIVEDTIQNGVKHTNGQHLNLWRLVEDVIQNGVKDTKSMCGKRGGRVDNIIENGVKHTEDGDWLDNDERIDEIIENGLKV